MACRYVMIATSCYLSKCVAPLASAARSEAARHVCKLAIDPGLVEGSLSHSINMHPSKACQSLYDRAWRWACSCLMVHWI